MTAVPVCGHIVCQARTTCAFNGQDTAPHTCADPDACANPVHLFDGFRPAALAVVLDVVEGRA